MLDMSGNKQQAKSRRKETIGKTKWKAETKTMGTNLLEIEGRGWTRSYSPDACILGATTCILKEEHEQSASFRG